MRSTCLALYGFVLLQTVIAVACGAEPPAPFGPVPSARQLAWHDLEMYGFLHFGPNTFANREWGFGDDQPDIFQPTAFDADQVVRALKDGGLKGVILTAKHHDGYCLWPSKFTEHCVKNSPWKGGKGDVVRDIADACKQYGLKFGVYISPWDRNHAGYGESSYVEYYKNTITELLSNYGPVFEMWFDGACGGDGWYGGQKGRRKIEYNTYYDWKGIRDIIRRLQPDCAIWCAQYREGDRIVYADCRWGGSEGGDVGDPCWNSMDSRKPKEDWHFGTRGGDVWCPAEGDVSIRPGWFYHADQDNSVKPAGKLMEIYYSCVGRGANLILNVPPDKRGLVHENDVKSLRAFRELMEQTFGLDLAKTARATASNTRGGEAKFGPAALTDDRRDTYWATDDGVTTPEAVLELNGPVTFNVVRIREYLPLGERVDEWALDAWEGGGWREFARGASIGNCRLVRLPQRIVTEKVRLRVTRAPVCPAISELALFAEPVRLGLPRISRDRKGMVTIAPEGGFADIRYTLDGSEPNSNSPVYSEPFLMTKCGMVRARNISAKDNRLGDVATETFDLSKTKWRVVSVSIDGSGRKGYDAIDDNPRTIWHTNQPDGEQPPPQELVVNLGADVEVRAFSYLPRQDGCFDGMVDRYRFYLSADGRNWGEPAAEGEFGNLRANPVRQTTQLVRPQKARFFKFVGTHSLEKNHIALAEIGIIGEE